MNKTWPPSFPWRAKTPWDVEVAVVGGGPAGLAAAIRLRWQKTFPLVGVSVALVNSGPMGGLAKLGNSILSGPALAFPAGGLVERLAEDLARWPVPQIDGRVQSIVREDGCLRLEFEDGRQLRALSVIVASGMLDLRNLWQFWKKGVAATFGSRANLFKVLERELTAAKAPVVLGGPALTSMAEHIRRINPATRLLVPGAERLAVCGLELLRGRLLAAVGEGGQLAGLQLRNGGSEQRITCDTLLIDFNSLELSHPDPIVGLPRTEEGFLQVDQHGATVIPGLFGAGDACGPPFAAAVAIGRGVTAAFACYRYVHQKKFNEEPALFAYYGDERVAAGPELADFTLHPELTPDRLLETCPIAELDDLWAQIDGTRTLNDLATQLGLDFAELQQSITRLLTERALTFHSLPAR